MEQLYDQFQRKIDYLRLSITDRCNLRCVYCMPEEGLKFFPKDKIMSQDEIIQLVKNFAKMGITKVRLTGGEPLLRRDLPEIIQRIRQISEINDISITTNGTALKYQAKKLKEAGLDRLNISLDTFNPAVYKKMTRGGNIKHVLQGIAAAERAGFKIIKVNTVVVRGENDQEVMDFINYTKDHPINVRFIEYMPIGQEISDWKKEYVPLTSIFNKCREAGLTYEPLSLPGNGPADNYQIKGYRGSFGLIHPISERFCESCDRLRITSDGYVKACLYWNEELNIRPVINDFAAFKEVVQKALNNKPLNHEMAMKNVHQIINPAPTWRHMSQIGG